MNRQWLKPIRMSSEASSSIHQNISRGYYETTPDGDKAFVPYDRNEMGEIHQFISPRRNIYKHMKWTKTRQWKDRKKAAESTWKYRPTYGGLNTISK